MTTELLALIAAHFLCSAAAEQRVLDSVEAGRCAAAYTAMKRGFLDPANAAAAVGASPAEAARLNARAYRRYVLWMEANPALASELRARARRHLAAQSPGA